MNTELALFLQHRMPIAKESAVWGNGTTPLAITSYLSRELPLLDLVTSVRAVVIQDDQVLVVRDPGGYQNACLDAWQNDPGASLSLP